MAGPDPLEAAHDAHKAYRAARRQHQPRLGVARRKGPKRRPCSICGNPIPPGSQAATCTRAVCVEAFRLTLAEDHPMSAR